MFGAIAAAFAGGFIDALAGFGGAFAKHTAKVRLDQYAFAWDIIKSSPLLGADLQTYMRMGASIEGVHNMWLRLAAHGGLFSVLVMILLLARIFFDIRRSASVPEKYEESMIATAYFAAMMLAVMFYVGMGEMFWALLGVATSISCIPPFPGKKAPAVISS